MCLGGGVCVSESALRGQKVLDPLGLELDGCEPPGMCLKNQTKSSAGAVLALNYLFIFMCFVYLHISVCVCTCVHVYMRRPEDS